MPVAMAMLLLMTPSVLAKTAVQASAISPGLIQFRDAQFSEWKSGNVTYLSSTAYNAMGMAPLYRIANQVIELFVGEAVLPDGKKYERPSDCFHNYTPQTTASIWKNI